MEPLSPAPLSGPTLMDIRAPQTISFQSVPNHTLDNPTVTLTASSSSSLPVSFSVLSGPGSVSGNTLTLQGVGTVLVRASQAGNGDYTAAAPVDLPVIIDKRPQTITFPAVRIPITTSDPLPANGHILSRTPRHLHRDLRPARVSGNVCTLNGVTGTILVRAEQPGNEDFLAAAPVSKSQSISPFRLKPSHLRLLATTSPPTALFQLPQPPPPDSQFPFLSRAPPS